MKSASIVIAGGGIMGASVAYHLARRGWKDLLVVDRATSPGAGSTGRSTGGFRAQHSTDIHVRLSRLSLQKLLAFHEETGIDPGYEPAGYLWLASTAEEMKPLRAALRVQHAAGLLQAREVGPDEIGAINPHVRREGLAGGCFCATDGFIRSLQILQGYLQAAERLGVRIEWGREVVELEGGPGGRIGRVVTDKEEVTCQAVVNAGGAWAASLAAMVGLEIPVQPAKRQVAVTQPCADLPAGMPMTLFVKDGFHLRVRDQRVLLLRPDSASPGEVPDLRVAPEWTASVFAEACRWIPALGRTAIDSSACWAGLYEMSPDHHCLLGSLPECENFYLINGSSGHGVMHAPALGQLLSEIISEGKATSLDVSALSPSRFAENRLNPGSVLL